MKISATKKPFRLIETAFLMPYTEGSLKCEKI
jgi:hypothetical protein